MAKGGVEMALREIARSGDITEGAMKRIEVENRDEFVKKCQSNGISVKRIPKGDSLLTFVEDYDGNLFEVKE